MTFLGLELNLGLTVAFAVTILGVLWNYSSLPDVRWTEVAAGVMAFLAGAGLEYFAGAEALQVFTSVSALSQLVALLYMVGGLLVLVGGLLNGIQLLNRRYGQA